MTSDERSSNDLCFWPARALAQAIRSREVSCREVMSAHLAQIDRVNPKVNAIVTRVTSETVLAAADQADRETASGDQLGPLHGLPIAHKDLVETKGIRTTFGSPLFADYIPERDALLVERLRAAGAIAIGKTNTPEWGAGSQTFNPIFGATLNPYDLSKTCGGSSGGAAVALACGMIPIADGSDHGGSLRNPGNFNNIVGFRPSAGRVPRWPNRLQWYPGSVSGPMARTVADVALLFSAMAGPDGRDPLSIEQPGETFARPLERDFQGVKVAWSPDLGGLPIDPRVTAVLERRMKVFEALGCEVEEATPDLSDAEEIFQVLRAYSFAVAHADQLRDHRSQLKDTVIWNTEQGLKLSALDLGRAQVKQAALYERMREFMSRYAFLLCPVNQVPPFDVTVPYPTEINGEPMEHYIAWMRSAYYITVTGAPAISVPADFTDDDPALPVGLQIVGRYHDDFGVLQLAQAFEQATEAWRQRPSIA